MAESSDTILPVIEPDLQISFYFRFQEIKNLYLGEALQEAIINMEIPILDNELANLVPTEYLRRVASFGIRGEAFFPVPYTIQTSPHLLGYYRLLYGISQKDFYNKSTFSRFKAFEQHGRIPFKVTNLIPALCKSLISTGQTLLDAINILSLDIIRTLQIITIGPQLRGGILNKIGQDAIIEVYNLIKKIVEPYMTSSTPRSITMRNEPGNTILVNFSADPDISIKEILPTDVNPIAAIEIKGGGDSSNIYNRIGEAEKSHEAARDSGFHHLWTIVRAAFNENTLRLKYPNLRTTQFFNLEMLTDNTSKEYQRFRELFCSLISIRSNQN
ncbi:MAG: XcyI family restriction endonuclease [Deltaproteobacteria bacterium]|nr:XcyI family restriction endonuclease [Deltaproteobacteria bacterium]